ncbi:MAG: hypothetical protein RLZZ524_1874 [Pseudomonadota bacterium]
MSIRDLLWNATTSIVADTIALFDPLRAAEYRRNRLRYRKYAAATNTGPYQLWSPTNTSAAAEVSGGGAKVRAKVRDLERNNPLVAGIVRKRTTMIVGDMVGCKPIIRDGDGQPMRALNDQIEQRFYAWAATCGADGSSLTEICQLVQNHKTMDGEFIVKDILGDSYSLQPLETDYLDTLKGQDGVEYNELGRATGYWLYAGHPGDVGLMGRKTSLESSLVSASMIHWFAERSRASQHRGISPLASAVLRLYGLDDLEDSELVAARSSASFGLVIESPMAGTTPWTTYGTGTDVPADPNGRPKEYLDSGAVLRIGSGEKAYSFKSERPNSNFDSFHRGRQRSTAGATGLSYESATGDYSQVNYSSARMGRIVEWAGIRREQAHLVRFLNRVYAKWLSREVAAGLISIPSAAYVAEPMRYTAATWQLAGNDSIDPLKEIETLAVEIGLGVNSRTRWCAERGRDHKEIVTELSEEKLGLIEADIYREDPLVAATTASVENAEQGAPNATE